MPCLIHLVWFRWSPAATAEQIDGAMKALVALQGVVPGVLEISVGKNITERSKGYTHGLLVKLVDAAALPVYADHPAHLAVVKEHIAAIKEDVVALDYMEGEW